MKCAVKWPPPAGSPRCLAGVSAQTHTDCVCVCVTRFQEGQTDVKQILIQFVLITTVKKNIFQLTITVEETKRIISQ